MKVCRKCGLKKPLTEFHRERLGKDGRKRQCRACQNEKRRAWAAVNSARDKTTRKSWWRRNPHKAGDYSRSRLYDVSPETFSRMIEQQRGRCAICTEEFRKTPNVDHDHSTNAVRALLCGSCNLSLGGFRDNPALLRRAADYLDHHAKRAISATPAA